MPPSTTSAAASTTTTTSGATISVILLILDHLKLIQLYKTSPTTTLYLLLLKVLKFSSVVLKINTTTYILLMLLLDYYWSYQKCSTSTSNCNNSKTVCSIYLKIGVLRVRPIAMHWGLLASCYYTPGYNDKLLNLVNNDMILYSTV